jgi:outer membrane protein OmpA-like peptidoglycan-associated protein
MKKTHLALTLTAIGLASLATPAGAQMYVGGAAQPAVEVNLDALDALPQSHSPHRKKSVKKVRLHAPRVFRDQNDELVSYRGAMDGPMTYEQAVRLAGGTTSDQDSLVEQVPLDNTSSSRRNTARSHQRGGMQDAAAYDTVDNLNRLSVECSAGNMLPRGQAAGLIEVSDDQPVTSAGTTSIPTPLNTPPHTVPATRAMNIRTPQKTVDLPDTPQVVSTPLPPSPRIETTPIPADVPMAPAVPTPAPSLPLPMAPTPVAMTPPPAPARLLPDDLKIDFSPNSEKLPGDASLHLNRLAAKLTSSPDLRVELRSFATGSADMASKARRLALARALAVRSYLTSQGVDSERIDVRALGNAANAAPGDRVDIFLTR